MAKRTHGNVRSHSKRSSHQLKRLGSDAFHRVTYAIEGIMLAFMLLWGVEAVAADAQAAAHSQSPGAQSSAPLEEHGGSTDEQDAKRSPANHGSYLTYGVSIRRLGVPGEYRYDTRSNLLAWLVSLGASHATVDEMISLGHAVLRAPESIAGGRYQPTSITSGLGAYVAPQAEVLRFPTPWEK